MAKGVENPWNAGTLEEYLYYCCPECSFKAKIDIALIDHAVDQHPRSNDFIQNLQKTIFFRQSLQQLAEESKEIETNDIKIKVEHSEETPSDQVIESLNIEITDVRTVSSPLSNSNLTLKNEMSENNPVENEVLDDGNKRSNDMVDFENMCHICSKTFAHKKNLKRHVMKLHSPKKDKNQDDAGHILENNSVCYYCEVKMSELEVREHVEKEHKNAMGRYFCPLCDKTTKTYSSAKWHIKSNHTYIKCDPCNRSFMRHSYGSHVKNVHADHSNKQYKCDQCSYKTWSFSYIRSHRSNKHVSEEKPRCKVCNETFRNLRWYYDHKCELPVEEEDISTILKCSKCEFEGTDAAIMYHTKKVHVEKFKPPTRRIFVCEICSAEFLSVQGFLLHKKSHDTVIDPSELTCDLCKQTFSKPGYLRFHNKRLHGMVDLEDSQHMCHICSKTFPHKKSLKRHVIIKHSEKLDKKQDDNNHVSVLKCYDKTCSKTFKKDCHLQEHYVTVHEGKTPHACSDCGKKFGLYATMMKHKNQAHGSLNCDECGQGNFNSYRLGEHKRKYHQSA